MKVILQLLLIGIIASFPLGKNGIALAQVPNGGFENWTANDPNGWTTLDFMWETVTQSNDAHSGSSAAKMEIIDVQGSTISSMLQTTITMSERPGSLTGYYKFAPVNVNSVLSISAIFYKGSILNSTGFAEFETNVAAGSYTNFSMPVTYYSSDPHDSVWLVIILSDTSEIETAGSYALLDDISFGGATSVKVVDNTIPSEFSLKQNYPNPFNPSTKIEFLIAEESFVDVKVYDILGKEVATLVNETRSAGNYSVKFNANGLSSGIYFYQLTTDKFTATKKFTLLK